MAKVVEIQYFNDCIFSQLGIQLGTNFHWRKKMKSNVFNTPEYKAIIEEFNAIDDRAVAVTIATNKELPLSQRLQIYDFEEANRLEEARELHIIMVCFNEVIEVKGVGYNVKAVVDHDDN